MESVIICPFCKEEQDMSEIDIDYSGESFEVICDVCEKGFQCQPYVYYKSFPDGIYIKNDRNISTEDISEKIIEKLKEAKNLYRSKSNPHMIYSIYQVEEDLKCFDEDLDKKDYIQTLYSINGKNKEITKYNVGVIDSYILNKLYIKVR
jgi:transcription elongation factor Elf1